MSPTKKYKIYISHGWTNNENYGRMVKILNGIRYFYWENYSVSEHEHASSEEGITPDFHNILFNQIRHVDFIIIFAGMYNDHREMIEKEIEIAKSFDIPIVGIKPWEEGRDVPSEISDVSKMVLGWKSHTVANGIQRYIKI